MAFFLDALFRHAHNIYIRPEKKEPGLCLITCRSPFCDPSCFRGTDNESCLDGKDQFLGRAAGRIIQTLMCRERLIVVPDPILYNIWYRIKKQKVFLFY